MRSDSELLRQYVKTGSEEAFSELVTRHCTVLYHCARRQVGDPHKAQDVVQIAFTELARQAPSLCARQVLLSWLYTTCHHTAANIRRSDRRRENREREANQMKAAISDFSPRPESGELALVLDEAMQELKQSDQEAVLLRFFQELSFHDVAAMLGVSEEAARKRVNRALAVLETALGKRGITSTAVALSLALASEASQAIPSGLAASIARTALAASTAGTIPIASGIAVTTFMSIKPILVTAMVLSATLLLYWFLRLKPVAQSMPHSREHTVASSKPPDSFASLAFTDKPSFTGSLELRANPAAALATFSEPTAAGWSGRPISADPEQARLQIRASNGKMVDATYARFYQLAGFSAEQRIQFRELRLDRGEQISRLFKASAKNTSTITDGTLGLTFDVIRDQAEADYESTLLAEFGPQTVHLLRYYDFERVILNITRELQRTLGPSAELLSAVQKEKLKETIVAAASTPDGVPDFAIIDRDQLLARAGTLLSPNQLKALRPLIDLRIERAKEKSGRR